MYCVIGVDGCKTGVNVVPACCSAQAAQQPCSSGTPALFPHVETAASELVAYSSIAPALRAALVLLTAGQAPMLNKCSSRSAVAQTCSFSLASDIVCRAVANFGLAHVIAAKQVGLQAIRTTWVTQRHELAQTAAHFKP
jgi:hypothetical protein